MDFPRSTIASQYPVMRVVSALRRSLLALLASIKLPVMCATKTLYRPFTPASSDKFCSNSVGACNCSARLKKNANTRYDCPKTARSCVRGWCSGRFADQRWPISRWMGHDLPAIAPRGHARMARSHMWPRDLVAAIHFASWYLHLRYNVWCSSTGQRNENTERELASLRTPSEIFLMHGALENQPDAE